MNLIERYVLAVSEYLPEKTRGDVADELRSNIEDMLPENPDENDIRRVLEKLGNPKKLAQEYHSEKRYLIGPGVYDSYISTLKMIVGIVAAVIFLLSLLSLVIEQPNGASYTDLVAGLFSSVISGCLQAAFWVTLAFAVMERTGLNENETPFARKKWSPEDLPTAPVSQRAKISRTETMFSMFFTVLFVTFLYFRPELLAIYTKNQETIDIIPLFNIERLRFYLTAVFILALLQLSVSVWKFVQAKWTVSLAAANAVQNTAAGLLFILMFNDRQLFNQNFLGKIGEIADISASGVSEIWFSATAVFTVVIFAGICLWDSISAFLKCRK